jgi:glycosyltransferase involved in cell wall biosynthesis
MSIDDAPLVSVVTSVYNGADFLAECIESVLKQTYGHYEYIIVNNCSTDRTLEIALTYAQKDSRIRVRTNDRLVGVIENHNLAFSLISPVSKYCKVVSADDYIFPECLTRMVDFADAHPSVGLVGSYAIAGKNVMYQGLEYETNVVNGREICRATLLGGPYLFGSPTSLLYRSDLIRATKAFYPTSNPHADTTACYEALEHSDFGFVHQVLSHAGIHADSQTSRSLKFGVIRRAGISDPIRFGPRYLEREEVKKRLKLMIDQYYTWLIPAVFEHSRDKEFWRLQKVGLADIGFKFSSMRLAIAVLRRGLELMLRPGAALKRLSSIKRDTGQIEAQYYE